MNVPEANDDAELVARWLGRTINNKYVVQSVVGSGGMAVVYAVKHRNGKRFALKMLHRELSLNPLIRQRFLREGYVANRVEHDGAVAVIDDDITEDGSAFLVMELLHGGTLEHLWEGNGKRLTLECVLSISEQLLDVLAAAHAQNIVHRDLKPANVFVTRNGTVKILDFGIARLRENDGSKTESGTTLGTPLFMPPEQASGRSRDVDARTDLWAVGATMFSCLAGDYVHNGENAAQVLIAVATTPARSLAAVLPDAPPEVVGIVDRALAFYNDDRWASAVEMRAAVLQAQAQLGKTLTREALGQFTKAIVPGTASSEGQSTPATTPAPIDRTERMPVTPAKPPNGLVPSIHATKPSAVSPREAPPRDTPPPRTQDPHESVARAVTTQTPAPSKGGSRIVLGVVALVVTAAVAGGMFAVKFFSVPPSHATALVPPPPVPAPSVTTLAAPPTVAPSGSLAIETPAPPVNAPPSGGPEAPVAASSSPVSVRVPPPVTRRPGGHPTRTNQAEATAAETPSGATKPGQTEPTPAEPPATTAAQAATTAPSTTAQAPTRRNSTVLDRTSPFAN